MDDFEKEFPDFDWKNTPAYKHPGGKNCPCPKHEYIREQIKFAKQVNDEKKAELWPLICNSYPDYDLYQKKTKRNIPVFDCQPT